LVSAPLAGRQRDEVTRAQGLFARPGSQRSGPVENKQRLFVRGVVVVRPGPASGFELVEAAAQLLGVGSPGELFAPDTVGYNDVKIFDPRSNSGKLLRNSA
jgi:hypothetical protein